MLACAFDEHPLFRLAFPKAASRSMILQTLFTTVLKDAIRFGRVEVACSHKIVGMLIWYPPALLSDVEIPNLAFAAALCAPCCGQSRGPHEAFPRPDDAQRVPPQAAALSRLLSGWNEADDKGWPIYLETQERRSVNLYARLGFKMLQDGIETFPGGPLTWTMWRAPQVSTQPF
jgi:hypothetical protein